MRWSLFLFPVFIAWFVRRIDEKTLIESNPLKNVFGSIYEGLKLQRKRGVQFYVVYTLRRLLFALVLVNLDHVQIECNMFISVLMLIYLGSYLPWENPQCNILELFNECTCLILQYHQVIFTDFCLDIEVKCYQVSSSFIFTTYIIIIVNFLVMFLEFARMLISKRKWWLSRKKFIAEYEENLKHAQKEKSESQESSSS